MASSGNTLFIKVILAGLVAFGAISTDLYLAGIPLIVEDFNTDIAAGQFTLSIFMFGFAAGQLFYGPFSDYYGRRPLLLAGICLYCIASIICIFATSMEMLLLGRLLQGLGGASGPVIARAIVTDKYKASEAARVMSYLVAAMATAPAIAPIFGSWLLNWYDWHSSFVLLLIFGLTAGFCVKQYLGESLQQPIAQRPSILRVCRQFADYLMQPVFFGYVLCGSLVFGVMFAHISSASFIVIQYFSLPPQYFGYVFWMLPAGYFIGAITGAKLVPRLGLVKTLGVGAVLALLSSVIFMCVAMSSLNNLYTVMFSMSVLFAAGGMVIPNAQVGAVSYIKGQAGGASSVFGFIQTAAGAGFGMIVGHSYDGSLSAVYLLSFVATIIVVIGYWFCIHLPQKRQA